MASTIRISILADAANAVRGLKNTGKAADGTTERLAVLKKSVDKVDGKKIDISLKLRGFAEGVAQIVVANLALDRIRKGLPDLSFGLTGIARKFTLVAAAALAATAAALPLAGAVVAVGAALGAAGAGVALFGAVALPTLQAVTTAVGEYNTASHAYDRAKAAGDTKKMNKAVIDEKSALNSLTPVQRAAALQVIAMNKAWADLSATAAPTVLGIINRAAATLAQIIPQLTPAIDAIGTALSKISDKAFTGLAKSVGPFVNFVKGQGAPALTSLATIVGNIAVTAGHLIVAFAPLGNLILARLTPLTAVLRTINFDALAKSAQALMPLVNTLFSNLAGTLGGVVRAAAPLAGPVLRALGAIAGVLKTAFASADIKGFVRNLVGLVGSVAPIVAVVVPAFAAFARIISGQLLKLMPTLVPLIGKIADAFVNVLTGLSPLLPAILALIGVFVGLLPQLYPVITALRLGLVPVLAAAGDALKILAPALLPLAKAIGGLLAALAPLIPVIATLASILLGALAGAVRALLPALKPLVVVLGAAMVKIFTALAPVVGIVAGVLADLLKAVTPLIPVFAGIIVKLLNGLMPVMKQLAPVIGQLLTAVGNGLLKVLVALTPVLPPLITAIQSLVGPILAVVVAMLPLIPMVANFIVQLINGLLPAILPLIPQITALANTYLQQLVPAIAQMLPVVQQFLDLIVKLLPVFTPLIPEVLKLVEAMLKLFPSLLPVMPIFVQLALLMIRLAAYAIPFLVSAVKALVRVVDILADMPAEFLAAGTAIMRGLVDGIDAGLTWVRDKVKGLGALIPGWLKEVLGISSPSTVGAGLGLNFGKSVGSGVLASIPHVKNALSTVGKVIATGLAGTKTPTLTGLAAGVTKSIKTGVSAAGTTALTLTQPITGTTAAVGNTYAITVNVAPGADPSEAGRQTVSAISAYERRTGRTFLATAPA